MKRACLQQNTNTYEQNHASSIRPLKINFVRMKTFLQKNRRVLFGIFSGLFILLIFGALTLARPQMASLSSASPNGNDTLDSSIPKVDIKVNKKYDEKGNLIEFDSVWTSESYSGDSIFRSSKFRFKHHSENFDSFFDLGEAFADTSEWFHRFGSFPGHRDIEEMEREMYRHMQWMDSILNRMWNGGFGLEDEFFRRPFDDFFKQKHIPFPGHFFYSKPDSFFYHFNTPFLPHSMKKDTIWF